jgi:hypothetical protein
MRRHPGVGAIDLRIVELRLWMPDFEPTIGTVLPE